MKLTQSDELPNNVVRLFTHRMNSLNALTVQAGTNCPQGGDSGHGGRTVLRIINEAHTDLRVRINGGAMEEVEQVEILLGGDCEAFTFAEGLEFAAGVLRLQLREPGKGGEEKFP